MSNVKTHRNLLTCGINIESLLNCTYLGVNESEPLLKLVGIEWFAQLQTSSTIGLASQELYYL